MTIIINYYNILFQDIYHKIMIKKKRFSLNSGTNFIVLRSDHPSGSHTHSLSLTSEIVWKSLHFDDT